MEKQTHFDFVTSIGLMLLSLVMIVDSYRMAREMMLGALILALYTFLLAPRLPFWMSTSIFMIFVMAVLKATSILKNILITALVVGSIYGVFQVIFHVPLP